jgi:hypothetical protein
MNTDSHVPKLVQFYKLAWPQYVESIRACANTVGQVHAGEQEALGDAGLERYWGVLGFFKGGIDHALWKEANAMVDRFVWLAAGQFAPEGARLDIDPAPYKAKFLPGAEALAAFDPMAVWDALQADYAGGQGAEAAYAQIAAKLAKAFEIKEGRPMETKSGATILNLSVQMDSSDQKFFKRNRLYGTSRENVCATLDALAGFMAWAGVDAEQARQAAGRWIRTFGDIGYDVVSRKNVFVIEGLNIVTFHYRFEFRFYGLLREQLPVFVSLYAAPLLRREAA